MLYQRTEALDYRQKQSTAEGHNASYRFVPQRACVGSKSLVRELQDLLGQFMLVPSSLLL